MKEPFNEQGQTRLEIAAEATKLLLQQKLLLNKSHEVGIVILGSAETQNDLADQYGGYENITVLSELDIPSLDTLHVLNSLQATQSQGDPLDALVVALMMISERVGSKKFKKRIFLLTDGNSPICSEDQVPEITQQLNQHDIKVNVVAIGFAGDSGTTLSAAQEHSEEVFRLLISGISGALYPSDTAMKIYKQFRKRAVYPVAKYRGSLDLGLGHCLSVCVYSKTKAESLPSLKKHSKAVEHSVLSDEGLVKMTRETVLEEDPTGATVDNEEAVKGYYYGKSLVPVSAADEDSLRYETRKCMELLGYLPEDNVPRAYFMTGVDMVLPGPDSDPVPFNAFVQGLFMAQNVALIRYCPRDNQQPKLAVLSPCIKPSYSCLWLNVLPTNEELRDFPFADLTESSVEQQCAAESFIAALSLDSREEQLAPSSTFNPSIQYLYQCMVHRVGNPDSELPALDPNIANYLLPDRTLFGTAERECDEFASKFVLREIEQVRKEKNTYKDIVQRAEDIESDGISEMKPVEDFYRMLRDRKVDRVGAAIVQMKGAVLRLLGTAFQGNTHHKALECLRALRQGCLDEDEIESFNEFMVTQIKGSTVTDPEFWDLLVAMKVSLITSSESAKSRISQYEAAGFLVKTEKTESEEDLMDDIE